MVIGGVAAVVAIAVIWKMWPKKSNLPDISDISKEYQEAWQIAGVKQNSAQSHELKEALTAHYLKKSNDEAYAKECNDERDAAFIATDTNKNGMLDCAEYIEFCKTSAANISRRIGCEMKVNSQECLEA